MTIEFEALGENLGPCPCCHPTKLKTHTPTAKKSIATLVKNNRPLLLKVKQETLYVDRAGKVWALGDTGKYLLPRGTVRDFVDLPHPKVRKKRATAAAKKPRRLKKQKLGE